ncbi:MAG: hypothetical protein F4180_04600 [Chloroflexi bacterium]|nr:hypothetical protein [Chloroflexota bacterium]
MIQPSTDLENPEIFADPKSIAQEAEKKRDKYPHQYGGDQVTSGGLVLDLTRYQKAIVEDRARFLFACITRQGGKSCAATLKISFETVEDKDDWLMLSASERQGRELMLDLGAHLGAIGHGVEIVQGVIIVDEKDHNALEVPLKNGRRVLALAANASTARGRGMSIYLDEFGFHRNSWAIWSAVFASITRGHRAMITSTPSEQPSKFNEMRERKIPIWKYYDVNIHQAIEQGLELYDHEGKPATPDQLRQALDDEVAWAREYLLKNIDESGFFLPYELLRSCEAGPVKRPSWVDDLIRAAQQSHERERLTAKPEEPDLAKIVRIPHDDNTTLYGGYDVARSRHFSVLWIDRTDGTDPSEQAAMIEMRDFPFRVQYKILDAILRHPAMSRVCIDRTGIGMQLAEDAEHFHPGKVEGIAQTQPNNSMLSHHLKNVLEDRATRIPNDETVRESLHSMMRELTATGHERFVAKTTDQTGHADHYWAKALCEWARKPGETPPPAGADIAPARQASRLKRWFARTDRLVA